MLKKKFLLMLPLMAILLSGCRKPNTAKRSEANLKFLGLAALMYSQEYDGHFPDMSTPETAKAALYKYVREDKVFINPSTDRPYQPNTALSGILDGTFNDNLSNSASTILFYEDAPYDDGTRGFVYANGYVDKVPESDWPAFFASHTTPILNPSTPSGY